MAAFEWDEAFVTGISKVDEQHLSLVALFNELNSSLFTGKETSQENLSQIFGRLIEYAVKHFSDEEQSMIDCGLDVRHIESHRIQHAQFIEHVRFLWNNRNLFLHPSELIMDFLTTWLGFHILGVDQAMARQMEAVLSGVPASVAFVREEDSSDPRARTLIRLAGHLYHTLSLQNADLCNANRSLESRVHERTVQLEQTNELLLVANARLMEASRTDGLLQIFNRKYLEERFLDELARAQREQEPLAVLMMDVDSFKKYNDTYGHQDGDKCLQLVVRAIRSQVRRRTDVLARYGGEELIALLPNTNTQGANILASRVLKAVFDIAIPHSASEAASVVTLSIGVASQIPPRGGVLIEARDALILAADKALYEAKARGRNQVVAA